MQNAKSVLLCSIIVLAVLLLVTPALKAQKIYDITYDTIKKAKAFYDDPRPVYSEVSYKKVLPPDVYEKLTYDQEAMKSTWAEIVGFKAPDVVGKIAPDVKPGTYSYQDKQKYPFKELMAPEIYERFQPGGPPFIGNFSEIKVVPTRQYYWALPVAQATKKYMGTVKLDDEGYMDYETYEAGIPFPRPSGEFAGQQVMYNWEKRYYCGESYYMFTRVMGFQKALKNDFDSLMEMKVLRLDGRVMIEPFGWYDERAEVNREARQTINRAYSPRDLYGNAFASLSYEDPNKMHLSLMYLNVMRRVRTMSGTDTQDPMGGQDYIYEDGDGFNQKLTPHRYPYDYEVLAEREYLFPAYTLDGSGYLSEEGKELKEYEFERRPVYVVKLTQKDPNFVYSYRVIYFDKETFVLLLAENYDQKGRLYRTFNTRSVFHADRGMHCPADVIAKDHIDTHSMMQKFYIFPVPQLARNDVNIRSMIRGR